MKCLSKLSLLFIIVGILISCTEPTGAETTLRMVGNFYSEGAVERFEYYPNGSWIQVKMRDNVLRKGKYARSVKRAIENGDIDTYSQFRFKVKVLSLEHFESELLEIETKFPEVKKVQVIKNGE